MVRMNGPNMKTEDEARNTVCYERERNMLLAGIIQVLVNKDNIETMAQHMSDKCVASECAWWVWAGNTKTRGVCGRMNYM